MRLKFVSKGIDPKASKTHVEHLKDGIKAHQVTRVMLEAENIKDATVRAAELSLVFDDATADLSAFAAGTVHLVDVG